MSVIKPNVVVSTQRGSFDLATKVTSGPSYYLTGVRGRIRPNTSNSYTMLPTNAPQVLAADYVLEVDEGTDIAADDRLASITLVDGVTPWPGDLPAEATTEYWQVTYAADQQPGVLSRRTCYIKRTKTGGPSHR